MAKKEFLRHLWCKKVILLKHGDRTRGQKELHWGYGGGPADYILSGREEVRDGISLQGILETKFPGP